MDIATFTTQADAQSKIDLYDQWAQVPSGCTLTFIYQHTTQLLWWFIFDDCINNAGLGKDKIAADEANLTIVQFPDRQALIDAGYLPQPGPP